MIFVPKAETHCSSLNSNSDSANLSVPKLRDDGSNWADYSPRIQKALGSKGLWRHVEGTAIAPKPYALVDGVPVLSDGKTPASEEQIEARETRIIDFEKREYFAQHVILSTTSTRLGAKIKDMKSAEEMWAAVKSDATTKSTLYLSELKDHFQLMIQRHNSPNHIARHSRLLLRQSGLVRHLVVHLPTK